MSDTENSRVPNGVSFNRERNNSIITIKTQKRGQIFFLIPFTIVWAGGSLGSIYGTQIINGEFDLTSSLTGLPFLIGSVFLVLMCYSTLWGKQTIKISNREIIFVNSTGVIPEKKQFRWPDILEIKEKEVSLQYKKIASISVVHSGGKYDLGSLKPEIRGFLLNELQKAKRLYNP